MAGGDRTGPERHWEVFFSMRLKKLTNLEPENIYIYIYSLVLQLLKSLLFGYVLTQDGFDASLH